MYRISQEKRKANIAEYVLFQWQMEDLLRGLDFDMEQLTVQVLSAIENPGERKENKEWFEKMAATMRETGLRVSGHLPETYEVLNELQLLQHSLLTVIEDKPFRVSYRAAKPIIAEFQSKSDKIPRGEIETALTALYGFLTLKISGQTISKETAEGMGLLGNYVGHLARLYRDMKAGKLPLNN